MNTLERIPEETEQPEEGSVMQRYAEIQEIEDESAAYAALARLDYRVLQEAITLEPRILTTEGMIGGNVIKWTQQQLSKVMPDRFEDPRIVLRNYEAEKKDLAEARKLINELQREMETSIVEDLFPESMEVRTAMDEIRLLNAELQEVHFLLDRLDELAKKEDQTDIIAKELTNLGAHIARVVSMPIILMTPLSFFTKIAGLGLGALIDEELEFKGGDQYADEIQKYKARLEIFANKHGKNTPLKELMDASAVEEMMSRLRNGVEAFTGIELPGTLQAILPDPVDEKGEKRDVTIGDVFDILNDYFLKPALLRGFKGAGAAAKTQKVISDQDDVDSSTTVINFITSEMGNYRKSLQMAEAYIQEQMTTRENALADLITA